ncbi:MAG TPA: hypothetical protein VJQ84_01105 [Solirubrobacterales bacterium]|nr:hypothetical protein [Solirubrobacterales bacterium]
MGTDAPYALLWSGGKDSALALARARKRGLDVRLLLNFFDPATGRVRFHATRVELIEAQARAALTELRAVGAAWDDFDAVLRRELAALAQGGYAGVVLGDIHLADVRAWYEERVTAAGLEHVEPIWAEDPAALVTEFAATGGRAVITCVEEAKLDGAWLGRVIDESFPAAIAETGIDACGERGEYHTFAFAGPAFAEPLAWRAGEVHRENGFAQLDLLPA